MNYIEKAHYPLLLAICLSLFTTPLMAAGVNAVLPEIGISLTASATQLSLVGSVYSLGLAIFQLASGSLGDIAGHKRIFISGSAIFALSSICAAFSNSIYLFLFLRLIQGIGGAMLSASGLALIAAASRPENRASYLALSSASVYAGIACGPPLAGFITGLLTWRWLFWLNSLTCILAGSLMKIGCLSDWRPASGKPFDWQGTMLYALCMSFFAFGSALSGASPWAGSIIFAAIIIILHFFWKVEKNNPFPVLNTRLLAANRPFRLSCLAAFLNYASFFGLVFYFSFYLQIGRGLSVQLSGAILAFQSIMQLLATPLASRLCRKWQKGNVSALGTALCGIGLLVASQIEISSSIAYLLITQALLGAGISIFSLSNTALLLESAGEQNIGQASALTGAARTAGQLISMAMITLALTLFLGSASIDTGSIPVFMKSMRFTLVFLGILNILAIGLVISRNYKKEKET